MKHGIYQQAGMFNVWVRGRFVVRVARMSDALRAVGDQPQAVVR